LCGCRNVIKHAQIAQHIAEKTKFEKQRLLVTIRANYWEDISIFFLTPGN